MKIQKLKKSASSSLTLGVDVKSEAGQEALRSAAANGHADVVELLDEKGVDRH